MHRVRTPRPAPATAARRTLARWFDAYLERGFSPHVVIGPHR